MQIAAAPFFLRVLLDNAMIESFGEETPLFVDNCI
jgi:hypothetical protein